MIVTFVPLNQFILASKHEIRSSAFTDNSTAAENRSKNTIRTVCSDMDRVSREKNLSLESQTRSDTNQAVPPQKINRGFKFQIQKVDGLYYLHSENTNNRGSAHPQANQHYSCSLPTSYFYTPKFTTLEGKGVRGGGWEGRV